MKQCYESAKREVKAMARQMEGVAERLIECAKAEFLEKGFKDASLRTIAENAETSTGSIYTRFGDKEGLFRAIVAPAVAEFEEMIAKEMDAFNQRSGDMPVEEMFRYTAQRLEQLVDSVYNRFDVFKILICFADGTEYENFLHRLAEIEVKQTIRYIEAIGNDALQSGRLSRALLHMLSSAYWAGVFQTVEHDMPRDEALQYVGQLKRFYRRGWNDIFFPAEGAL